MPITVAAPSELKRLAKPLREIVREALVFQGRRAGEIHLELTGDAEIRALNHRWRGIDRATDVISFAYDEGPGPLGPSPSGAKPGAVNGDLVISMPRAFEQAKRFRVTQGAELARLAIHGALHLAGLDHKRAAERRHMRAREDVILRKTRVLARRLDAALGATARGPRRDDLPPRSRVTLRPASR